MLDRNKLISHLYDEHEQFLGRHIIDKLEMVLERKGIENTNFLNPYESELALGVINQVSDINYLIDGGYQGAERKRISIFPDYLFMDSIENQVSILKISGNFKFQQITHRDFLGALMSLGIKREMIGDILILDDFTQVIIALELEDFIQLKLNRVHQIPVEVKKIRRDDLVEAQENTREINATVASMCLDAVASAGFGDSRSKISRDIKGEKVKLNWKMISNPASRVEIEDMISIRGRGRVKVKSINGKSHRGRIKLSLLRYT